jgi:glycosyltransferase involved in cell wall biosynthesis
MSVSLKVVHVVLSLDYGGVQRLVLDLVREGRHLGQQVAVVCLKRRGEFAPQAQAAGGQVFCMEKRSGLSIRLMGRVKRLLRQLCPQVIHTHQMDGLIHVGPAAAALGVPVVVHTQHGKRYALGLGTRIMGRLAGGFCSRFFCVSKDLAKGVRANHLVPSRKISVVRNGINTQRFREGRDADSLRQALGIPRAARIIGTVGRLHAIKRQDLLLRAFARVRNTCPDVHLVLVGDGPLLADLRAQAGSLALTPWTHFAGYQAEPERHLALMDVFALTSEFEGMPLALLEAWAAGVPVVAAQVGGIPELVDPGNDGLLFPSGDEGALTAALARLLGDAALAKTFREAGRHKVESQFTIQRTARHYQDHYLALLGRPRGHDFNNHCQV